MIHPDTELRFINETIGYGVVATRLIPCGTITWVRDDFDQTFSAMQVKVMSPPYREIVDKYCFVDVRGDFVLCWDIARYVNHSCEPTCLSAGYDFELAVRDIQPGDELTDDYGSLNIEYYFACHCASPACRGTILPSDILQHASNWDAIIARPFRLIHNVLQPLWPLVKEKGAVEAALAGRTPIASCRQNHVTMPPLLRLAASAPRSSVESSPPPLRRARADEHPDIHSTYPYLSASLPNARFAHPGWSALRDGLYRQHSHQLQIYHRQRDHTA